jgi:hypothetical protein
LTTKLLHDFIDIFFLIILLERFIQKVITFQIHYFVGMDDTFDREKIVDCMFDPITSSILAELEDGEKECSFLAQQSSISELEVLERLSYLIEHGFISKNSNDEKCLLSANSDKLTSIVENSDNFDTAISELEKMDSYLN